MAHSSGAKQLVDSLEERMARISRHSPINLVMDLDPNRIDRLARELPKYIEFLQSLHRETQHHRGNRPLNDRRTIPR